MYPLRRSSGHPSCPDSLWLIQLIPSLLELTDKIGHLKIVILDDAGNELAAALSINDLSGLPITPQNVPAISDAMNLNQEETLIK